MTNNILNVVTAVRDQGIDIEFNGYATAYLPNKGVSIECHGSRYHIYINGNLFRTFNTPQLAVKYLIRF